MMHEQPSVISELAAISGTDLRDKASIRAGAQTMEALLLGDLPQAGGVITGLSNTELSRLQKLYEQFETDLEYEYAQKIINGEATLEQYPLYSRFQRLIQAEIDLADINERDRVLFIGSGPLPISPILVSQMSGARVNCFDHSTEACETSQRVVDALGLSDRVGIINARGDRQRIFTYSVVMVALLAQPKSDILYNVQFSLPDGTRAICRTSEGNREAFYKPTSPEIYRSTRYQLAGKHQAGMDDTISSLLFRITGRPENR